LLLYSTVKAIHIPKLVQVFKSIFRANL